MQSPPDGIQASLMDESDVYKWQILMNGPENSPYAVSRFSSVALQEHHRTEVIVAATGRTFQAFIGSTSRVPFQTTDSQLSDQNLSSEHHQ